MVSLQNARKSARDAKRIADVKQMQTALELYFNDWQTYPTTLTGSTTIASGTVYMVTIPTVPTPADGTCSSSNVYTYAQKDTGASYVIKFCLGGQVGNLNAGPQCATPGGIVTTASCS